MNMKRLFLLAAVAAFAAGSGVAQTEGSEKWNAGVGLFLNRSQDKPAAVVKSLSATADASALGVLIECTDAAAVVEAVVELGATAVEIDHDLVTARLTPAIIRQVAELEEVKYIAASRKFRPTLSDARALGNVDKVHSGTGLETPFTGKGVIMGIIDQGFEYKHRAFLDDDGNTRLRALWIRESSTGEQALPITDPTKIPTTGDGLPTDGHGTHVANIAAGSPWGTHEYYGVAPDAELIFIPSSFEEDKVIEEVRYIKRFAEDEDKPWVVNMSFGSHIGPHDGQSLGDRKLTEFCADGGLIVAAMGNEGNENIHTSHKFDADGTVTMILSAGTEGINYMNIWEQSADGASHLTVKPFLYNKNTKKRDYKNTSYWRGVVTTTIDAQNDKENHLVFFERDALMSYNLLGLEVTGKKGAEFHAWSNGAMYGEFVNPNTETGVLEGDSKYTVGDGTSSIPAAIAVGAYTAATSWEASNGSVYNFSDDPTLLRKGQICSFSSYGPMLNPDLQRPTILAPGSAVKSAVSYYTPGFRPSSGDIVAVERYGTRNYYYGVMAGTSQASPFVAGVLALWLEAHPGLKYQQAIEILRKTAKVDSYTRNGDPLQVGSGKVDAYEGLKEVLKLAETDGINDVFCAEEPVTLGKENDRWNVLFNTSEPYADVLICDMSGRLVKSAHVDSPRRGTEIVITLDELPAGAYIINVSTAKSRMTRKIIKQ